jgi:hypothetical protein
MNRRMFIATVAGASSLFGLDMHTVRASSEQDKSWKSVRGVFFIGAMPWVRLFEDDRLTCWASVAWADWSPHGRGRVVVLRWGDRRRAVGDNESLATWLYEWLESASPDSRAYKPDRFEKGNVEVDLNLDTGLRVRAGEISLEMGGVIDRQLIHRAPYRLGDFLPTASWVRMPCAHAHIELDGTPIAGKPKLSTDSVGSSSTAQINVAEVWTT